MDNLDQVRQKLQGRLFISIAFSNLVCLGSIALVGNFTHLSFNITLLVGIVVGLLASLGTAFGLVNFALAPLKAIWLTILHYRQNDPYPTEPNVKDLPIGKELVSNVAAQVNQLANEAEKAAEEEKKLAHDLHRNFIANNMPLPLFVLDASDTIVFTNEAAAKYVGISNNDMLGKNIYMVLDMSFPSEDTFDSWLKEVKNKTATASSAWERVRLNVRDNHPSLLFDLSAYYNRDNPDNHETMLMLFDHTKQYSQDEQAVSFIALSVHEIRTPLTLLRGYIEVFEEELDEIADPELHNFMQKMHAMAEQLTAFVNNILNVARVDGDQLELRLQKEDWPATLKSAIDLISLRAKVRGITLKCRIHHDIPPVGVDRLSIREVVNNLIDNAIKYSGDSKVIQIETKLNAEGLVETTIQDFGLGIPPSILPNLFTKFYRDHHNRAQIGGTGLGLYLSKAIVNAHGGNIWVKSEEGKGSTFGFTLMPYDQIADELKHSGDTTAVRNARGWVKNHSLYRQ